MQQINYYKCVSEDWSTYEKGQIYPKEIIGNWLTEHPKDWKPVKDYPTTQQLIECIDKGTSKNEVLKALKQWKNQKFLIQCNK